MHDAWRSNELTIAGLRAVGHAKPLAGKNKPICRVPPSSISKSTWPNTTRSCAIAGARGPCMLVTDARKGGRTRAV
jgi:hypothetical protein